MGKTIENNLVQITHLEGKKWPVVSRGNSPLWSNAGRMLMEGMQARLLGHQVGKVLLEIQPKPSQERVKVYAEDLATQQPPLSLPDSFNYFDGVRDALAASRVQDEIKAEVQV